MCVIYSRVGRGVARLSGPSLPFEHTHTRQRYRYCKTEVITAFFEQTHRSRAYHTAQRSALELWTDVQNHGKDELGVASPRRRAFCMLHVDDKRKPLLPPQRMIEATPRASITRALVVVQRDLAGSLSAAAVVLVLNITCAAIVFPGAEFAHGVTLALLSSALGTMASLVLVRKGTPNYLFVCDAFMAALVSISAAHIRATETDAFGTLVASMTIASLVNTVCYVILGCARVGKLVEFIPSPVLCGYMLSIGYTLLSSAAAMLTNVPLVRLPALVLSAGFPTPSLAELED